MKAPDAFADYKGVVSFEFCLLRQVGLPDRTVLLHCSEHRPSSLSKSVSRHHKWADVKAQCALEIHLWNWDLPEEVNEPWSYFARLSRAYEERFANVQKEAVKCPLALHGMQHSSHGANTASDQVSVISVQSEIPTEDIFDCIARDIIFLFGYFRSRLFCVVHNYC